MIMEAEKSCDLPSRSWRPRIARGVAQRPQSQRADGVGSDPNMKVWEPGMLRTDN